MRNDVFIILRFIIKVFMDFLGVLCVFDSWFFVEIFLLMVFGFVRGNLRILDSFGVCFFFV